jgi:predicted nuclease with RNAse H fold
VKHRSDAPQGRVRRVGVAEALAGLDLAGSERRISGVAIGDPQGRILRLLEARGYGEILEAITRHGVRLVAVDAPLGHAEGYREVDLEARRMGFKLLPPGWRGMRMLVDRALRLRDELAGLRGVEVIETHPRSALRSAGCSYEDWERCVSRYLDLGGLDTAGLRRDVVDAVIALAVALAYLRGEAQVIRGRDGAIWLLPAVS